MKHIIVTGSMSFDVIMNFPSRFHEHLMPEKLHMINVSFVVDKLERQFGGTATNIAYNLAIAGCTRIKLLSSIGKDGGPIQEFLQDRGIDTSGVLADPSTYTATGHVITDQDDNQIWGFYYGACAYARNITLLEHCAGDDLLVISANHPDAFLSFQRQAIQHSVPYLYDPGMTLSWNSESKLKEGVLHARWLVGNDYEIGRVLELTGLSTKEIVDAGVAVITTLGEKGVEYQDRDTTCRLPAYSPKIAKDPTGAGDAWRAGFLYGWQQDAPIRECLAYGNAVASFAVEHYGTVNHAPTRRDIEIRKKAILDAA